MAKVSPILHLHQNAQALFQVYGGTPDSPSPVALVASYSELELEYASIRKGCGLFDQPHRAVLEVTGPVRVDFLNRMITQELKGLAPGTLRRAFWLNRKGRIDADLRVIHFADRTLLEVDIHAADRALAGLSAFVVMEDVAFKDITETTHRLALHGRTSLKLLAAILEPMPNFAKVDELLPEQATIATFAGEQVVVFREDATGDIGLELIIPTAHAEALFTKLIQVGHDAPHGDDGRPLDPRPHAINPTYRLRPIGWHAFNIARIEGGTPLYNIDFGPNSLPAETGVIDDRVSFKKGCYLGQEVVARMHSRGHSKQTLVALRFDATTDPGSGLPFLPDTGSNLLPVAGGDPVGTIASATLAPMLGTTPIAFAGVKPGHTAPGTELVAEIDGRTLKGTVQPTLTFWKRGG